MDEYPYKGIGYNLFVRLFRGESLASDIMQMAIYGLVAVALWLVFAAGKKHRFEQNRRQEKWFLAACMLIIILTRVTSLYWDIQNPDEAHILVSSLNLNWDHRLWVAMDSTTLGPLCYVLPALLALILSPLQGGYEVTLMTGRLCGMLLLMGGSIFLHEVALKHVPRQFARLLTLALVIYFCFSWYFDIQAYNSEYLFFFFSSAYIYVLEKIRTSPKKSYIVLAGLWIGLFPYIKLQVLPMTAALGFWTIYLLAKKNDLNSSHRCLKRVGTYCLASLLPTTLLIAYISTYAKGIDQGILFNLKNALAHTKLSIFSEAFFKRSVQILSNFFFLPWMGAIFTSVSVLLVATSIYLIAISFKSKYGFLTTIKLLDTSWRFSLLLMLSAVFAVIRPGTEFHHYILFMVAPVFYFSLNTLRVIDSRLTAENMRLIFIFTFIWMIACFWNAPKNLSISIAKMKSPISSARDIGGFSQLLRLIVNKTEPDDAIVVWGWEARINLYTQRRSATAQSDIQRLGRKYPRENTQIYISNILQNKPKLIVDVVAPGSFAYSDAAKDGINRHESIYEAIRDRYILTEVIKVREADNYGSYRVYTRKN